MREVKFRGKRFDNNHNDWIYGHLHVIDTCGEGYTGKAIQQQSGTLRPYSVRVHDESVGQFIGLKDKNGNEVFEGDVVIAWSQGQKEICEVMWGQGRVGFFLYRSPHIIWNLSGGGFECTFEMIEVIGSKHDDPDLLNA